MSNEDFVSMVGNSGYFRDSQLEYLNIFTPELQAFRDKVVEELKQRNFSSNKALEP